VNHVLLDIGADFTSAGLGENWTPLPRLFSRYPNADSVVSVFRREHLFEWDRRGLRWATCYHIVGEDSFRSLAENSRAHDLPLGARADWVRDDDYLVFAVRDGLIGQLVYVLPDSARLERWHREVPSRFREYACRVRAILAVDLEGQMPAPQIICCSLLAPSLHLRQLLDNIQQSGADENLADRAILTHRDSLCGHSTEDSFVFPYNAPSAVAGSGAWLYHGSQVSGLKTLVPTEDRPVFFSPVPGFAACFGVDLRNEKGWIQGTDVLSGDAPFTYLVVPSAHEAELQQPCSLYRVSESATTCEPRGSVSGFEYACGHEIPVTEAVAYPSVAEALTAHGVRVFRQGVVAIKDRDILDLLDSEQGEAESFFELSGGDMRSLPFFAPLLYAFFVGRQGHAPSRFSPQYRGVWARLLRRLIFPALGPYSLQPTDGFHGLSHSFRVALDALTLALEQDANPLLAMIAGVLHDAARTDDDEGRGHALAGSFLARAVLPRTLPSWVAADGIRRIADAVEHHVDEELPTDVISQCLNDSDRLRLAWERGFEARFFSTPTGKRLARRGADFASNWFASRLRTGPSELKFEVTSACDLACRFCHRNGVAAPSGAMKFETFESVLRAGAEAGIGSIRLTGGEPFLHREFRRLAEAAQTMGFEVVVNTNATAVTPARMLAAADVVDCFKVSLPAFGEAPMRLATGSEAAWSRKLEAIGELVAHGCRVEVLTVMTPDNIRCFDRYLDLLGPLGRLRWVPLRPEPTPHDRRPISVPELRALVDSIDAARSIGARWEDLYLHLAVPFCAIEDPERAARVLKGRLGCGPADSLTVTSGGELISCYSRRTPLETVSGVSALWRHTLDDEAETLPEICQSCAFGWRCQGGCRCEWALEESPQGRFDYLANPAQAANWSS
jgi:radical SAM protein with 4Fe4S-binding SPASM domain